MAKTKIEWTDATWNPVWGCYNGCDYCYAIRMSRRFAGEMAERNREHDSPRSVYFRLLDFKPTWLEHNFRRHFMPQHRRVFVNSMSDIEHWKPGWLLKVLHRVERNPGINFQFLTKNPAFYHQYEWPANAWLGVTATNQKEFDAAYVGMLKPTPARINFISLEPLHERIVVLPRLNRLDWLIVGAETGRRPSKIRPDRAWVEYLIGVAGLLKVPIFLKDNLIERLPGLPGLQQFPEVQK